MILSISLIDSWLFSSNVLIESISSPKNSILTGCSCSIINKSISLCIDVTDRQLAKETIETHKEVLNCIKSRDINGAYDAMYLHLVYNRRNIKKLIEIKNNETHLDI